MTRSRRRAAGFTLVELMVTLVIVAVVTIQVLAMMSTQEKNYYAQKRVLESQIDARLIADMVMRDVRAAGFMVPTIAGVSSRDGGNTNVDAICASDPAVIAEAVITNSSDRLGGAPLTAALGVSDTVSVSDSSKDIDGDGDIDFLVGSGIIISDGTRTHCARIEALGSGTIRFTPDTPSGFAAPATTTIAVSAVIYEISNGGLRRNNILVASDVEDFQVQFGVDTSGNGILEGGEFPIDDLNVSGTANVQLVEVSVLTRTATEDPGFRSPGRPAVANRAASGTADAFRRRLVSVARSPRNLL